MRTLLVLAVITVFLISAVALADNFNGMMLSSGVPTYWTIFDGTLITEQAGTRAGIQPLEGNTSISFCTSIYVLEGVATKPNLNRLYIGIRLTTRTIPDSSKPDEVEVLLEQKLREEGAGWGLSEEALLTAIAAGRKQVPLPAPAAIQAFIPSFQNVASSGKLAASWGRIKEAR